MTKLNPHTLPEDARWLMWCSLMAHKLIKRGLATCETPPLPDKEAVRTIERMIHDHPDAFRSADTGRHFWEDDTLVELGMKACAIRFGLVACDAKIVEAIESSTSVGGTLSKLVN